MSAEAHLRTIGIDLLQERFQTFSNIEYQSKQNVSLLLPSALLPLYPGEKGIFGQDALDHRRAKGWQRPNECRMFWNNDSQKGCGRVVIAAAMQRLVNYHLSWGDLKGSSVDTFSWQPFLNKQVLSAAELIIRSLQNVASNTRALIALPLPDNSTQSAQQALLNAFYSRNVGANNCGSTLMLLRRSIAQAMLWCDQNQMDVAQRIEPSDRQHVGHLIVINACMDYWEARLVPLQWHQWCDKFHLVPIDSEHWPRECLQVSGWQIAANWLKHEGIDDEALWQSLVGQELLHDLLYNQELTPQVWAGIRQIESTILPHTVDLCSKPIPELVQIEQSLQKLQNRQQELRSEDSGIVGVIIDGCCAQWFKQLNLLPWLKLSILNNSVTIADSGSSSLASQGGQLYAQRQSEGLPTYLEKLIPICIWCRNSSRYGQEFIWKTLISNNTIPAGQNSQLKNCPGFILPAGQNELQLILRRPSIDLQKDYEYRKIPAKIYEKFSTNINVTINVEVKPGSGLAKARLLNDDGHLLSELKWKAMSNCERPSEHKSAYLARPCEALCDDQHWYKIERELAKLNLKKTLQIKHALYKFEEPLEAIYHLFNNSRVKPDKDNCYLEWRVISSEGKVVSNKEQLELLSQFLEACYLLADTHKEKVLKKRVLQVMRHLFTATSTLSRQRLLSKLDLYHEITTQELLCIGQSLKKDVEISKFFESLLAIMCSKHQEVFYWLRALRAILRYRYEAYDPEIINDKLYQDLWDNIVNKLLTYADKKKILKSALQCLIYMLGRRRFDKNFVSVHSSSNTELNRIIKNLKRKQLHLNFLEQLEKLLNSTAAEEDIQLLLSNEVSDDIN